MSGTPRTHIVGAGLMGASIGIGLSSEGWDVTITDADAETAVVARSIGAGGELGAKEPELVIVAAPPQATVGLVVSMLETFPNAIVTDVASVKAPIRAAVDAAGIEGGSARYVGSHPMAGREVAGVKAAQGDLFRARPWVVCPGDASDAAVALVRLVPQALQCDIVTMDAADHDRAVARVSHAPQAVSSAVAAALGTLSEADVSLAGQGLRDVTRIAASPPGMWAEIARLNRAALQDTIDHVIAELDAVRSSDDIGDAMAALVEKGRREVARIPGKHGGAKRDWVAVTVVVPDEPGHLVRLLGDAAAIGVNVEDLTIEHSPRQPVGLTTLWVVPDASATLTESLENAGWVVAGV